MKYVMNRRRFLGATAVGLASAEVSPFQTRPAAAADNIVAVMWGGPFIDASKPIAEAFAKQTGTEVNWELHAGGSVLILAKIRATWPVVKYDLTTGWADSFFPIIQEGWLETVTEDEIPNLKFVPPDTIMKDDKGNLKSVPLSITGTFWGYRSDLVGKPITSIEQLLEPKFKGQICMTDPINHTGLALTSFAIQRGGNEHNIDPGFEFVKELARRGNIGRIAHSEVDFINSLTTGETSVAFWNMGSWGTVAKDFPVVILNRLKDNKGFLAVEGWGILKGPHSKEAKAFANFFISAENNKSYNRGINEGPVNSKSKPSPGLDPFLYKPDEVNEYAYYADFPYISAHLDDWNKRWEI